MKEEWNSAIARKARRSVAQYFELASISQERFGAMIGAHRCTITYWETGRRIPEGGWQFIFYKLIEDPSFIDEVRRLIGNGKTT